MDLEGKDLDFFFFKEMKKTVETGREEWAGRLWGAMNREFASLCCTLCTVMRLVV